MERGELAQAVTAHGRRRHAKAIHEAKPEQACQTDRRLGDFGLSELAHPLLLTLAFEVRVGLAEDQRTDRLASDLLEPLVGAGHELTRPVETLDENARHVDSLGALAWE